MVARAKPVVAPQSVHFGLPASVYYSDPCAVPSLSASIAHLLISKSPLHAWHEHPRLGGKRRGPTAATELGTVAHALLLGTAKDLVVVQAEDWRTKAARDLRDAARAAGQTAVLQHESDEAAEAVKTIKARLRALGVRLTGRSEVSFFWLETADNGTVVQCRGRVDHLLLTKQRAAIYDFKSCRSAHPRACQSHAVEYGYDIQATAYRSALSQLYPRFAGREEYYLLFAEMEAPFGVMPCSPGGSLRELGARRWRRAVNLWAECVATKKWPGYADQILSLEAPPWALNTEEDIAYAQAI